MNSGEYGACLVPGLKFFEPLIGGLAIDVASSSGAREPFVALTEESASYRAYDALMQFGPFADLVGMCMRELPGNPVQAAEISSFMGYDAAVGGAFVKHLEENEPELVAAVTPLNGNDGEL